MEITFRSPEMQGLETGCGNQPANAQGQVLNYSPLMDKTVGCCQVAISSVCIPLYLESLVGWHRQNLPLLFHSVQEGVVKSSPGGCYRELLGYRSTQLERGIRQSHEGLSRQPL